MRILVVEDEPTLAIMLRDCLQQAGYAVDVANDGADGLRLAEQEDYALILLEVLAPTLDGIAVCRRLRSAHRLMPILMLAARDTIDDRVAGLDSGADDYLIKPFAVRELLARVRALLRRDELRRNPVLRVADVEVNTVSHEVRRAGRVIELTAKEYALLEFFVRNADRVLTRTQIAEHVWDFNFVMMSNVVDVYVGYLRRKLGDDREPRLLHTLRGAGYQLKTFSS